MFSNIQLSCPFVGCDEIVSYDVFKTHQENCSYNMAKCQYCNKTFTKQVMDTHYNDCNNFIRQKMEELVVHKETIKTELTETKLDLDNTKLKLHIASLELSNANLEIEKMAKLVVDREAIKTELTKTKLDLDNTKLQLAVANLKLSNANLEIHRPQQELRRKSLNQETGLNIS